jgi:predicted enzyme related to lactoylglutathione lyase
MTELCYFTIGVPDGERAQAFYGSLFGWSFAPGNVPGGFHVQGTTPPAGVFSGGETGVRVYFRVDDLEAALAKVRELGGAAGEVQGSVASGGAYAECADDQGVRFSLFQPPAGDAA